MHGARTRVVTERAAVRTPKPHRHRAGVCGTHRSAWPTFALLCTDGYNDLQKIDSKHVKISLALLALYPATCSRLGSSCIAMHRGST